jgi:hypothetical protein
MPEIVQFPFTGLLRETHVISNPKKRQYQLASWFSRVVSSPWINEKEEASTIRKTSLSSNVSSSTTSARWTLSENRNSTLFIPDDDPRIFDSHPTELPENTDPLYFSEIGWRVEKLLYPKSSLETKGRQDHLLEFDGCNSFTVVLPVTGKLAASSIQITHL